MSIFLVHRGKLSTITMRKRIFSKSVRLFDNIAAAWDISRVLAVMPDN